MDTIIGIVALGGYVLAILALSATVTFLVVKISPAQSARAKKQAEPAE